MFYNYIKSHFSLKIVTRLLSVMNYILNDCKYMNIIYEKLNYVKNFSFCIYYKNR